MEDEFLDYYERELTFIRQLAAEFAGKHPKVAARLLLEPDKCEDPHAERLLEGFAFIGAGLHRKIDDDFPEITGPLLNMIYPHWLNPVPSMSVVEFQPVKKSIPPSGYTIEKHAPIYSKPVGGVPCEFRTCYPVTLWPVEVASAEPIEPEKPVRNARQAIVIRLKSFQKPGFSEIGWKQMRFYINGPRRRVYHLYEILFNNVCHVECEWTNRDGLKVSSPLAPGAIKPVGFGTDELVLPFSPRSFPGHLLLFEYFCFPEKFLFFDLDGLDGIKNAVAGNNLSIRIHLDRLPEPDLAIDKETFRVNATPVINLFERIAEPVRVEPRKTEYRVVPDGRNPEAMEVFGIDGVGGQSASSPDGVVDFKPLYSMGRIPDDSYHPGRQVLWHHQRRSSGKKDDDGTEVFLSFTDRDFKPADPAAERLTVRVTCTNRDLPARLPFGSPAGDFHMKVRGPLARIKCILPPSPVRRPSPEGARQWLLLSHLSPNHLPLTEGGEEALREILLLYDLDNSPVTREQIDSIRSIKCGHVTKRMEQSFRRGVEITMEFDEESYEGAGLFLFASVLERFVSRYVSAASFTQLVARTARRKDPLKTWPPRKGTRPLL